LGSRRDKLDFVAMLILVGSWLVYSFVRLPLLFRTLQFAEICDISFAFEEFVVIRLRHKDVYFLCILPPLYPSTIASRLVLGAARHRRLGTLRLGLDQLPVVDCLDADGDGGGVRLIGGASQVVVD